jgi:hypothetical protein
MAVLRKIVSGGQTGGVSEGIVEGTSDGRLRLVEHFQWIIRPESGVNIFEEIAEREEQRAG